MEGASNFKVISRLCHTEHSEVSPEDFSPQAEIFGDSSLPSGVQNDIIILVLATPRTEIKWPFLKSLRRAYEIT